VTLIKIGKVRVDVLDRKCPERPCYSFGFDKGSFSPGRGYTSYYDKPKPVCARRLYHGCPTNSVCPVCRRASVDPPGALCDGFRCEGKTIPLGSPSVG
jgi:hypothetical protein